MGLVNSMKDAEIKLKVTQQSLETYLNELDEELKKIPLKLSYDARMAAARIRGVLDYVERGLK